MNTFFEKGCNVHPHPGPLPQAREKRSQWPGIAEASVNSFEFRFAKPKHGNRLINSQKNGSVQSLFPLPEGEGQGEGSRNF
jgi:hypothetical protein